MLVSIFSEDNDSLSVPTKLFNFNKNEITKIEYGYRMNNIDNDYEFKSLEKNDGIWFDDKGNKISNRDIQIILNEIVNMKHNKEIKADNSSILKKLRLIKPNYIFKIYTSDTVNNLYVGTDLEKIGYYYVSLKKEPNNIYIIEEYYINLLKLNMEKIFKVNDNKK